MTTSLDVFRSRVMAALNPEEDLETAGAGWLRILRDCDLSGRWMSRSLAEGAGAFRTGPEGAEPFDPRWKMEFERLFPPGEEHDPPRVLPLGEGKAFVLHVPVTGGGWAALLEAVDEGRLEAALAALEPMVRLRSRLAEGERGNWQEDPARTMERRSLDCIAGVFRRIRGGRSTNDLLADFLTLLHPAIPFDLGGLVHARPDEAGLVLLPSGPCAGATLDAFRAYLLEEARVGGVPTGLGAPLDERRLLPLATAPRLASARPLSRVSVPLRASGGRCTGRLVLASMNEDLYGRGDMRFLGALVEHLALVLENDALHRALDRTAQLDELTGLANARSFRRRLEREVARAERYRSDLSLVLVDLDAFRAFNEISGQDRGDELLIRLGALLDAERRSVDRVARFGPDLFALVLPETRREGAMQMAERLRRSISSSLGGDGRRVTVTIGVATLRGGRGAENDGLLRMARRALQRGKELGRDRVEVA